MSADDARSTRRHRKLLEQNLKPFNSSVLSTALIVPSSLRLVSQNPLREPMLEGLGQPCA